MLCENPFPCDFAAPVGDEHAPRQLFAEALFPFHESPYSVPTDIQSRNEAGRESTLPQAERSCRQARRTAVSFSCSSRCMSCEGSK